MVAFNEDIVYQSQLGTGEEIRIRFVRSSSNYHR